MKARIALSKVAPGVHAAMRRLEEYVQESGLDPTLVQLVRLRASLINGCAYCIDMHWKDALAAGEAEQRLYGLNAWRESPYYTKAERAALALTDAVTTLEGHVPEHVFAEAHAQFGEKALADLTLAIVTVNAWNRLMITFRVEAGLYQPRAKAA